MKTLFYFSLLFLIGCTSKTDQIKDKKVIKPTKILTDKVENTEQKERLIKQSSFIIYNFLSKESCVLDSCISDFNYDGLLDRFYVIKDCNEEKYSDYPNNNPSKRDLKIFINKKDSFKEFKVLNENIILPVDAGGTMGDPYQGMTFKKGELIFNYYGGAASRWMREIYFKYDRNKNKFFLSRDIHSGFTVSEDNQAYKYSYSQKDFGLISLEEFDIYKDYDYLKMN